MSPPYPAHPAHVSRRIARHERHRDPSQDRMAIQTVVAKFDEKIIRSAVEVELERAPGLLRSQPR